MFASFSFETLPAPRRRDRRRFRRDSRIFVSNTRRWGIKAIDIHIAFFADQTEQAKHTQMAQAFSHVANSDMPYVLLPKHCEYEPMLADYRLKQPEPRDILPQAAMKILHAVVSKNELNLRNLKAAIIAPRMNNEAYHTAHDLSRRVKSLALCGGNDTAYMAQQLRREYGVSILEQPSATQQSDTDVYILFDATPGNIHPRPGSIVLELGNDWCLALRDSVTHIKQVIWHYPEHALRDLPAGVCKQRAIALLLQSGVLSLDDLEIKQLL